MFFYMFNIPIRFQLTIRYFVLIVLFRLWILKNFFLKMFGAIVNWCNLLFLKVYYVNLISRNCLCIMSNKYEDRYLLKVNNKDAGTTSFMHIKNWHKKTGDWHNHFPLRFAFRFVISWTVFCFRKENKNRWS